ncbi:MAG: CAP domain-containing protein [Cyanobacteria bacterium P01_C01_bin.70]
MQNSSFVQEVVRLTNQFRSQNGLGVLSIDIDLTEAAQSYTETMAFGDFFSHTGRDGSLPWDRAQAAGYETGIVGENIGVGYRTPAEIVDAWIDSDRHRAAMLNPRYNEIGVGYYFLSNDTGTTNYNSYWTQLFGQGDIEVSAADGSPAIFDPLQYGASYGDLIAAFGYDPIAFEQHYITSGQAEGRTSDRFDEARYLASNPDLINVFGDDLVRATQHYIAHGYLEGRSTSHFGPMQYLASNRDVLNAYGLDPEAAALHYIRAGYGEGRSETLFDAGRYLASNADLMQHFGYDTEGASAHYIQHGISENRSTTSFNAAAYLGLYVDLQAAFGSDLAAATQHYVLYGFAEGRATGA